MGKLVANIDDDVKARAAALYDSMGMSLSTAVNMFCLLYTARSPRDTR